MMIPAALADLMITLEATLTASIDNTLSDLERGSNILLTSASVLSTTTKQAERAASALNVVRYALGRSDRRLQSLKLLFSASTHYMQDLRGLALDQSAVQILRALNDNMRSDVDQLLLQVQNNNVRVQTQQQLVSPYTTRES